MNTISILKFVLGIYLLASSYIVLKKHKLIFLLWGYSYQKAKNSTHTGKLEKDIAYPARIFGMTLILFSIIDKISSSTVISLLQLGAFIGLILNYFTITKNIKNDLYE